MASRPAFLPLPFATPHSCRSQPSNQRDPVKPNYAASAQDPPTAPLSLEEKAHTLPVAYSTERSCLAVSLTSGLTVTLPPPALALVTLVSLLLAFIQAVLCLDHSSAWFSLPNVTFSTTPVLSTLCKPPFALLSSSLIFFSIALITIQHTTYSYLLVLSINYFPSLKCEIRLREFYLCPQFLELCPSQSCLLIICDSEEARKKGGRMAGYT